jgi:hypothetical protein
MSATVLKAMLDHHALGHAGGAGGIHAPDAVLFLPEMGSYMFPVFTKKFGASWVNALPFGPQTVLYAAPMGVKFEPSETARRGGRQLLGRHGLAQLQDRRVAAVRRDPWA